MMSFPCVMESDNATTQNIPHLLWKWDKSAFDQSLKVNKIYA